MNTSKQNLIHFYGLIKIRLNFPFYLFFIFKYFIFYFLFISLYSPQVMLILFFQWDADFLVISLRAFYLRGFCWKVMLDFKIDALKILGYEFWICLFICTFLEFHEFKIFRISHNFSKKFRVFYYVDLERLWIFHILNHTISKIVPKSNPPNHWNKKVDFNKLWKWYSNQFINW
jgi:hypothetical protein